MAIDLDILAPAFKAYGLPPPVTEYRFHESRRWRFDYAYPDAKVAMEVEGGVWVGGRHVRGGGYINDCEKYNEAQILGWKVLRFSHSQIKTGYAFGVIARALNGANAEIVLRQLRADSRLGADVRSPLQDALLQANDPKHKRALRTRAAKIRRQGHGGTNQAGAREGSGREGLV